MLKTLALGLLVLTSACTREGSDKDSTPEATPGLKPPVDPTPTPTGSNPAPTPTPTTVDKVTVELTAVTLADDCGGTAPYQKPAVIQKAEAAKPGGAKGDVDNSHESMHKKDAAFAKAKRRCEQTSMQLAVTAKDATQVTVKSVELFDDAGKSLGTLAASHPTRWSDTTASYEGWDEKLGADTNAAVSYVLAQPDWSKVPDRWNKTYTLKVVVTVGGADKSVSKDVSIQQPTSLPPNVKT